MTSGAVAGNPVLTATSVTKQYRGSTRLVLDKVSLAVAPGTLVALVGPNGAGKSTLLKCWLGFERPTDGAVTVHGLDPTRSRGRALRFIGHVPQANGLFKSLTVADHLTMADALRKGFDSSFTKARLRDIDVPLAAKVAHLSGGQQAQLALALALGTQAPTLILDEPLASLDPLARREFMALLVHVVRIEGRTAILASHVVGDVADVCDRTIALVDGRVAVDLSVDDLVGGYSVINRELLPADATVVGTFPSVSGTEIALVHTAESLGSRATPDEVVMGFLAANRGARLSSRRPGA